MEVEPGDPAAPGAVPPMPSSNGAAAGAGAVAGDAAPLPKRRTPRGKHALSVATPSNIGGVAPASPSGDAKRPRSGVYTPGGSNLQVATWALPPDGELAPLSPSAAAATATPTTSLAAGLNGLHFAASPVPRAAGVTPKPFPSLSPAAPRDSHAPSLPPTHPHTIMYPASPSPSVQSSATAMSASATAAGGLFSLSSSPPGALPSAVSSSSSSSTPAPGAMASPSRSGSSSSASSPSALSLSGGTTSSAGSGGSASSSGASGFGVAVSAAAPVQPASPGAVSPVSIALSLASASTASFAPGQQQQTISPMPLPTPGTPLASLDEEDDEGGVGTSSARKRGGENRQGASCHQCKTTKDEQHLLFCTTKAGGARKRRCRKKYCDSCLNRTYGILLPQLLLTPQAAATWQCPSCLGRCTCAGCSRKGGGAHATPVRGAASGATTTTAAVTQQAQTSPMPIDANGAQSASAHTPSKAKKEASSTPAAPAVPAAAATAPGVASSAASVEHTSWPAAHSLPQSGLIGGRAVSAPDLGSMGDKQLLAMKQQQLLAAHRAAEQSSTADAALPSHHNGVDAVSDVDDASSLKVDSASPDASSDAKVSPAHMDAIASLLLELSTAASAASTSAPSAQMSDEQASMSAGVQQTHVMPMQTVDPYAFSPYTAAFPPHSSALAPSAAASSSSTSSAYPFLSRHLPLGAAYSSTAPGTLPPPSSLTSAAGLGVVAPRRPVAASLFPDTSVGLKRFTSPPGALLPGMVSSPASRYGGVGGVMGMSGSSSGSGLAPFSAASLYASGKYGPSMSASVLPPQGHLGRTLSEHAPQPHQRPSFSMH